MKPQGSDYHYRLAIRFSIEAHRSLLLVNAGSAFVFIALAENLGVGRNYYLPIILFFIGAVSSIFSLICAYLSQVSYAKYWNNIDIHQYDGAEIRFSSYKIWHWSVVILFTLSLLLYGGGMSAVLLG